jgi:hypothetical protein
MHPRFLTDDERRREAERYADDAVTDLGEVMTLFRVRTADEFYAEIISWPEFDPARDAIRDMLERQEFDRLITADDLRPF